MSGLGELVPKQVGLSGVGMPMFSLSKRFTICLPVCWLLGILIACLVVVVLCSRRCGRPWLMDSRPCCIELNVIWTLIVSKISIQVTGYI